MTNNQAITQMLLTESLRSTPIVPSDDPLDEVVVQKSHGLLSSSNTLAIGVSRLGHVDQQIIAGTMGQLETKDFGEPLHSLVLIGKKFHELELECVREFVAEEDRATWDKVVAEFY